MKKNKNLLLMTVITLGVIFCFGSLQAEQVEPTKEVVTETTTENTTTKEEIKEEKVIEKKSEKPVIDTSLEKYEKTYYWTGKSLDITGHFQNDVIALGNNIYIDGVVEGDVIAVGANVTIKADVYGDVRVAAGNIIIEGIVERNVTAAGGQITITKQAQLYKDLIIYGGTVQVLGPIKGEAKVGAGQINIDSAIGGNADLTESGQISLDSNAKILGNLTYSAGSNQNLSSLKSKVQGSINKIESPKTNKTKKIDDKNSLEKYSSIGFWVFAIIKLLALLLVALAIISFCPQTTKQTLVRMNCCPGTSFLWGALTVIFFPIICILTMITVIGIPLGLLGLVMYLILLYISTVFVGLAIGKKIMPKSTSYVGPALLGIIIVYIIKLIPYIGGVVCLFLSFWAIGALVKKKCSCQNVASLITRSSTKSTNTKARKTQKASKKKPVKKKTIKKKQ